MVHERRNLKSWHFPHIRIVLNARAYPYNIEIGCAGTLAILQDIGADEQCMVVSICE